MSLTSVWPRCPGMRGDWLNWLGFGFGTILSYTVNIQGGSHRLALCQGPRSCRARNRKTQSKDPWLRFRQITPFQTIFVLTSIYTKVSEKRWRSQKGHVTSHQAQSMIARRGPQDSLSPKFSVISTIISEVMAYCTNWRAPFFFDWPPSWKCQSNHTDCQTYPSSKWKMADPRNFGPIRAFFFIELSC